MISEMILMIKLDNYIHNRINGINIVEITLKTGKMFSGLEILRYEKHCKTFKSLVQVELGSCLIEINRLF